MIRSLIYLVFVFGMSGLFAAPLSLDFKEVKIVDFSRLVYGGILKRSYVVDPDLLGDGRSISVSVHDLPGADLERFASDLLLSYGVKSDTVKGVTYLRKAAIPLASAASAATASTGGVPGGLLAGVVPVPGEPVKPLPDLLDTHFYLFVPSNRDVASLQLLANSLLRTNYVSPAEVVLSGEPDRVTKVLELLKSLDRPRQQFVARAVLVEFNSDLSEGSAFQLALSVLAGRLSAATGSVLAGGSTARIKGSSIDAVLSAISSDSRFTFKTSPSVLVMDGASARLQVGDKVPTRGDAVATQGGAVAQQTVYRDTGVVLDVKPVAHGDVVDLTLSQQVSNFQVNTSSAIDSPTINVRQLDTRFQVAPGDVVFLAGLDQDRDSSSRSGLPFLPRALDSKSHSKQGAQLVLVLQLDTLN